VSVRIGIIVEGATEKAFAPVLRQYLSNRLAGRMPKLKFLPAHGRIPIGQVLKREVGNLLASNCDHVIALTDVYTGSDPPAFADASDAKAKMREWVGPEPRFHPHAAQYEFEAWLLPYWDRIRARASSNRQTPSLHPETVNHGRPPAGHLEEVCRTGARKRAYSKTIDGAEILRNQDIEVAVAVCPQLRAFLDTILTLSNSDQELVPG
jgi:hypothetical protein